jgi:tetratricopeptide (TPR) repeat protein
MKKKHVPDSAQPITPWTGRFVLAGVLLTVTLVYVSVVTFQFLPFWDDDTNIHRNPLYAPLSWSGVALFWKAPFQQLYIPVTYTVWAGLVALSRVVAGTALSFGPINASIFHGANLLVHLLAVAMVFLILRRMIGALALGNRLGRGQVIAAAAGSLAFGLHPVQVETVAWVSGLRDLLGGALSLASIELFLSWIDGRSRLNWLRYAGASLLLLLAFGSKPGTVVTPALALLCGAWLLKAGKRPFTTLLWLVPWFLLAAGEVVLTSRAQPAAELARSLVPVWARPLVAADALSFYLGKLLWPLPPWGLCADYGRSPNSLFEAGTLYWTWIVPVALVSVLAVVRRLRIYIVPCVLLAVGVLPTLGLIPFNFQVVSTVSDRYLYLGMLGPALALALFVLAGRAAIRWTVTGLLVVSWAFLSVLQLPSWASGEVFFPFVLSRNPTSWKSRHNYACTLDARGKLPEALTEFSEAIRLRPSNAEAYNDAALTLLKQGRMQEAITFFQQSLQVRATAGAARNLAAALLMNGNPAEAARVYRLAMQIEPGDLQNQRALAWLLATHPDNSVRNGPEAVALSRPIVDATGGHVPLFLLTLAASLAESGDFDSAVPVAGQSAAAYRASGDAAMGEMVEQRIIPALRMRQPIRDNPVK